MGPFGLLTFECLLFTLLFEEKFQVFCAPYDLNLLNEVLVYFKGK